MEKLFRGFIETSFSDLKQRYGKPTIENERVIWKITINENDYEIYDYLPLEFSNLQHKWRVDSQNKDISDLEELFNNTT